MIYLPGSYLVWRHISSICICWYQGQGHPQRSRSNVEVTFLKKWSFRGHLCFTSTSCFFSGSCKLNTEMIKCRSSAWISELYEIKNLKTLLVKEKMLVTSIFSFSTMFYTLYVLYTINEKFISRGTYKFSSSKALSHLQRLCLGKSEMLSFI